MRLIDTKDAAGHVLCHDITVIIRGEKKGVAFKKGHIVTEDDIPELLKLGKEHLYIWEKDENMYHEDEAAAILRDLCMGEGMHATAPSEGKIELIADLDGILTIRRDALHRLNSIDQIMVASRHGFTPVRKGDKLAGTRVIPLVIEKRKMEMARDAVGDTPILSVLPYLPLKAGIVTTGSEVYTGRIQDTFTPVLVEKLKEYGIEVVAHRLCSDDRGMITQALLDMKQEGCTLLLTTGGMSVDPDDKTPAAIRDTGCRIVSYGAPVLPGAMMMVAYLGQVPILGLPGCVMYAKRTIFDLLMPRVAAGVEITRDDIVSLGEGGLCLNCPVCTYPNCGFGK